MRWCCAIVCLALQSCAGTTPATEARGVTAGAREAPVSGQPLDGAQEVRSSDELIARRVARATLRWLRETFRPRRIVAINTHFHPDGTGGNDACKQAGVESYASDLTQELLATRGAEVRDATAQAMGAPLRARLERMQIVPALHTFQAQEGLTLTFGGESVQVFYPGQRILRTTWLSTSLRKHSCSGDV